MSPGQLRGLLTRRAVAAGGYVEATSLLGAEGVPRTAGPAVEVRLTTSEPVSGRQRNASTGAILVRRGVEARVLTPGNPAAPVSQWDEAEDGEQRIRAALLTYVDGDGLDCIRNTIVWQGSDTPTYLDGGAYRLAVLRFKVDYLENVGA